MPNDLNLEHELRRRTRFGRLLRLQSCTSTQDAAANMAGGEDAPDAVVWADHQTDGRGRQQREWDHQPGLDLAVTFRVRAQLPNPVALPAALPVAVLQACEPLANTTLRIKWPNDVYAEDRKLSGVLIDRDSARPDVYYIGVGVNVNRTAFPADLAETATSLRLLSGCEVDRGEALIALAEAVDAVLAAVSGDREDVAHRQLFCDRLGLLHREVTVEAGQTWRGRLTDIDFERLVLDGARSLPLAIVTKLAPLRR